MGFSPIKTAVITGASSQDAAYLAHLLLEKEYQVILNGRDGHADRYWRLRQLGIFEKVTIIEKAFHVPAIIDGFFMHHKPDEFYHLAAQSSVVESFKDEFATIEANAEYTHRLLDGIKRYSASTKFYNATSSEMFGKADQIPQSEKTPFHPRSPYGISKVFAFDMTRYYREQHNLFACSGILFNHESPLRGDNFVTKKICKGAVAAVRGGPKIKLGNLHAKRDWGHAIDHVRAMYLMLQAEKAQDYVIATGILHSIFDVLEEVFAHLSLKQGKPLHWEDFVELDSTLLRKNEIDILMGNPAKARRELGWEPQISFESLIKEMVEFELHHS